MLSLDVHLIRPALLSSFRPKTTSRYTGNCEHHSVGMPRLATRIPPLAFRQLFDWISCDPNVSQLAARLRCWQHSKPLTCAGNGFRWAGKQQRVIRKRANSSTVARFMAIFNGVRAGDPDVTFRIGETRLQKRHCLMSRRFRRNSGTVRFSFPHRLLRIVGIPYDRRNSLRFRASGNHIWEDTASC